MPVLTIFLTISSQLKSVSVYSGGLNDISNLKNSHLEVLELIYTNVTNIEVLENLNIKDLNLTFSRIKNIEIIGSLKKLETLFITPQTLPPTWEETIRNMAGQIKKIETENNPNQFKTVEKFLEDNKGISINQPKK